jgi:hypothetical protein
MIVAFRSAKERGFRGAKGDNPTDIDLPFLKPTLHLTRYREQGKPILPGGFL